jgi:type II secretory pathway component HofQ
MTAARVCLAALSAALCLASGDGAATRARAEKAEKAGRLVEAYLLYSQAAAVDPSDRRSWAKSMALRTRATMAANVLPPAPPSEPRFESEAPSVPVRDIEDTRTLGPPPRLEPRHSEQSFELKGDSKSLVEAVLRAFGIEVIFDADFQPIPNLRLRLDRVGFDEAVTALEAATATFLVPVSEKIVLAARDTAQKRQELEHTVAVAVPLPAPVSVQEAQELARSVQQLMEIQKFGVDSGHRLVLIRDRASKVLPALVLFEDLLRHKAEVHIEVELLEVAENSSLDLGLKLPTLFPITSGSEAGARVTIPSLLRNVVDLTPARFFALSIASSQLIATMADSSTRTLSRAELRSTEGQPVQFHVGDRYPILTAGYFGQTTGTGTTYTPPPSFNFEDLGLVLKITPKVHGLDEVGMDIEAEYKVLTGQALNGIPVIANRKFTSRARARSGEVAVITGMVRLNEARSLTGLAGLAQIPIAGALFRQDSRSTEKGQAVFVIRPRIVREAASESPTRTVWTGPEGRPRIPL